MRSSHKHSHIQVTLRLLKEWQLLFVPRKEKSKMKCNYWSLLASVGFAALLYGSSPALAQ